VVLVKMRVAALTCTSYKTGPHAGTRNNSVTAARAAGGSGGGVKLGDMHDGPRGEASRINVARGSGPLELREPRKSQNCVARLAAGDRRQQATRRPAVPP
jgi:hypothetical protein